MLPELEVPWQRKLDMLSKKRLLRYVIGSTDGYDDYRLTQLGAAYVTRSQQMAKGARNFAGSARTEA